MAEMRLAPNITADIRAHSALVEAFAVAGRVAEAAGALQAARDAGLAPTVVTYASVAKGHAMRGEYEAASGVLDQMEADGVAPNVRWSREGAQGEHRGSRDGAEIPARETRAVGARRRRTRHTSKEPLHAARCSAQPALSSAAGANLPRAALGLRTGRRGGRG